MLALSASVSWAKDREYLVTKVVDGDTVELESGEVVRYLGIDAPEIYRKKEGSPEFFAREAARYNKKLVYLKKVQLEFDVERKDQYGRLLAYVYVKGLFVNAELVKLGYAKAMIKPPNTKYKDLLVSNQQKAMDQEKGLWQEKRKDTEESYVGNKKSFVFHRPTCKYGARIPEKSRIIFHQRSDAIKIGYSPCKQCKP